jgi:hypothetical protein
MSEPDIEGTLFRTAKGALLFASNYSHGQMKKPFLAKMVGGGRPGRGLGGLDGAGQAGMIMAALSRLPRVQQALLIARHTTAVTPCSCRSPCCKGSREEPDWAMAVEYIVEDVLKQGLTGTVSHYRLRRALVMRYLGIRHSFVDVAKQCGINRDTASERYKKIKEYLGDQEKRAYWEIEGQLKAGGVVE